MSQLANDGATPTGDDSRHTVKLPDGTDYEIPASPGGPAATSVDWAEVAHGFLSNLPHPLAPSIRSGDYPTAARLAAATAHSSDITPPAVEAFWKEFNALNKGLGERAMAPEQYMQALKNIAPLSYVFHGRPPTMAEIGQMHDAPPEKVRGYFYNLPDQNYPDVPAGDMVKALQSATPFSRLYLGRDPVKGEARFLFHSGKDASQHYQWMGTLQGGPQPAQVEARGDQIPPYGIGPGGIAGRKPREAQPPTGGFAGQNIPPPAGEKPPPEGPDYIHPGGYGPGGRELMSGGLTE